MLLLRRSLGGGSGARRGLKLAQVGAVGGGSDRSAAAPPPPLQQQVRRKQWSVEHERKC